MLANGLFGGIEFELWGGVVVFVGAMLSVVVGMEIVVLVVQGQKAILELKGAKLLVYDLPDDLVGRHSLMLCRSVIEVCAV